MAKFFKQFKSNAQVQPSANPVRAKVPVRLSMADHENILNNQLKANNFKSYAVSSDIDRQAKEFNGRVRRSFY